MSDKKFALIALAIFMITNCIVLSVVTIYDYKHKDDRIKELELQIHQIKQDTL